MLRNVDNVLIHHEPIQVSSVALARFRSLRPIIITISAWNAYQTNRKLLRKEIIKSFRALSC